MRTAINDIMGSSCHMCLRARKGESKAASTPGREDVGGVSDRSGAVAARRCAFHMRAHVRPPRLRKSIFSDTGLHRKGKAGVNFKSLNLAFLCM
eukprot:121899-Pleurochrysis_carterae.AAC.1